MTQEPVQVGGRVLAGRYSVLEEIGRGGMGIVWLAEDRMIGRRVAIKELHLPAGIEAQERAVLEERVLREARTAGRLNDPGVVTVYDVLQAAGNTYIVMELIQAPTLTAVVRERGPLPQDSVAHLAEQLLSALESAHAAGIVHRDVKPSNIMVLPNGRVKLTDFGIAQSLDDPKLTSSGILVGSPTYMAPERISGAEADAASDLWALAAVLFYAVEGYSAFERSSTAATMNAILHEVPFLTRCHGPLASVIMGLLNATPAARPSIEQVRGLLAQASAAPVAATPPGGQPTSPIHAGTALYPREGTRLATGPAPKPRRRLLQLGAVVLVVAALVGAVLVTAAVTGAGDERPANMDETRTYGAGGFIPEFSPQTFPVGGCFSGRLSEGRRYAPSLQVACDVDHDLQIFHARSTLAIPGEYGGEPVDTSYPDPTLLIEFAERACTMAFDSEQVQREGKDALRYSALVPSERQWRESRNVYCVLYDKGTATLNGSRVVHTEP